jgi:hypothetical protein
MFKINITIMKKIKSLLILGILILVGFVGQSQQGITYRFNNMKIVPAAGPDTLIFDVEAKGTTNLTYTTTFTLKIDFLPSAFGANAVPVVVQQLALSLPTGYNFNTLVASVDANTFTSTFLAFKTLPPHTGTYQIAFLSNLTTTYQGLVRYKMLITGTGDCGIAFLISGGGSMQTGQNYVLVNNATATINYNPITAANNLLTLPSDPNMNLMVSEVGDPSSTTTNFVEIYNAGATTVDFTNGFAWYLNANGSSSVQLTGTLAAGGKYTVASDAIDFTPSLTSAVVGTGGTTNYLLSTYGDYATGTGIDKYDGSLAGFDYTGKHAVRHYNITAPNMTMTASEWVISAAAAVDMTPGSHRSTLTWNGSASNDWHTRNNWGGMLPDAGHNAAIPNAGEATPVIGIGDNAYAHDLNIAGSDIGLIIKSHPINGDGSLITYGTVTGITSVQRFLASDRFWYVSQPVTSATANVFLHTWLFTYDEPTSAWGDFIGNETTPLNLMKGYAVWTSSVNPWHQDWQPMGDTTTSYDGLVNTGTISTGLTKGGDGWNFVGNPYPSSVDWDAAGWTKTNLTTAAYYVWNGATYSSYVEGGPGVNGGTQFIPPAQGFFVNASAAGTLGVTNAVRVHSAQDFWKSQGNFVNLLSLTISNGEVTDETIIHFDENATTDLDYSFDARKMMAEASPQAFTMLNNDKMAINTFNNYTQTVKIDMGVNIPEAGEYTITVSNLESFDGTVPVYLEDKLTGQKMNLRETGSYTFTSEEGVSERFAVHFAEFAGIGDDTESDVNSIYAADNKIYVDFSGNTGDIAIYNILGQEISRTSASKGMNKISVTDGNAVYIVKVISDNTTVTKKVFVK